MLEGKVLSATPIEPISYESYEPYIQDIPVAIEIVIDSIPQEAVCVEPYVAQRRRRNFRHRSRYTSRFRPRHMRHIHLMYRREQRRLYPQEFQTSRESSSSATAPTYITYYGLRTPSHAFRMYSSFVILILMICVSVIWWK